MPFKSKAQQRKCYALKAKGKAKGWDCDEWSKKTEQEKLPETSSKEAALRRISVLMHALLGEKLASTCDKLANRGGAYEGLYKIALSLRTGCTLSQAIRLHYPSLSTRDVVKSSEYIMDTCFNGVEPNVDRSKSS